MLMKLYFHILTRTGDRRRWQFRIMSLMLAVALAAIWLAAMPDPAFWILALVALGVVAVVLTIFGSLMGLGWLGFRLVALIEDRGASGAVDEG